MPPKVKFTKEQILEACISIIDIQGHEALTIRSIADKLNCSTHPIMTAFNSIDILKTEVYKVVDKRLSEFTLKDRNYDNSPYFAMALNYIEFAKTHGNLYRFLYLSDDFKKDDVNFFTNDDVCYQYLKEQMSLTESEAKKFYNCLWFFGHGIASLLSVNAYVLSDKEVEEYLKFTFRAMTDRIAYERL